LEISEGDTGAIELFPTPVPIATQIPTSHVFRHSQSEHGSRAVNVLRVNQSNQNLNPTI
jgi:hypothetical protein